MTIDELLANYTLTGSRAFNCNTDDLQYSLCKIYFKTKEDAQHICDILNYKQFDL